MRSAPNGTIRDIFLRSLLPNILGFQYDDIRPRADRAGAVRRLVVLVAGNNPTFDYYIAPRLGGVPTLIIDILPPAADSEVAEVLEPGDYVLVCRYLNGSWVRRLLKARALAGLGFMFDDDYVAFLADTSVPLLYRLDVARRAVVPLRRIGRLVTDVFVSTDVLRERYHKAKATVLRPVPAEADIQVRTRAAGAPIRIAFHAQLSHLADHVFAAEVVRGLGVTTHDFVVDVIGPKQARPIWENIPVARFQAELDWPMYKRHCERVGADLFIAPFRDTPLNQARSSTKAIDAARLGAAGIFPRMAPYRDLSESVPLIEGGPDAWCAAIRPLLDDPEALAAAAARLRAEVVRWKQNAAPLVVSLQ